MMTYPFSKETEYGTITSVKDTNQDYHSKDSISASGLKKIYQKSVAHYLDDQFKKTKEMEFGNMIHTLLLEGQEQFSKEYYLMPKLDMRKKADKELYEQHKINADNRIMYCDQDLINGITYKEAFSLISKNFYDNEIAVDLCKGENEISHYGTFKGVDIRCRPDTLGNNFISDIKTCSDNSPYAFYHQIKRLNYDLQALFYCDVLCRTPESFRFIAIETKYPFSVQVYGLTEKTIQSGYDKYNIALDRWKEYLRTKEIKLYQSSNQDSDGTIYL